MVGIYLLVAVFTQFSPSNLNIFPALSAGPSEVAVEFDELNGIRLGSAVIAEGQLIGVVSNISSVGSELSSENQPDLGNNPTSYQLTVRIAPSYRNLLRRGTVALIASPLSRTRVRPETVVEFMLPLPPQPILKNGESIVGYSSYREFWSADLTKAGLQKDAFQLAKLG